MEFPIRFTSPEYLVLLMAVFWFWRTRSSRGTRTVIVRCAIAVLVVLGVSGLQVRGGTAPLSVMLVLDRSGSMDGRPDGSRLLSSRPAAMRKSDTAGVVVFGEDAAIERRPAPDVPGVIASSVNDTGTNIERALALARTSLPGTGARRIVLSSDGQQTAGHALDEAARANEEGIAIDVVIPGEAAARQSTMSVTRLAAPPVVRIGEPFTLTALVEGEAGARGEIDIAAEGRPVETRTVAIPAGGIAAVTLTVTSLEPGTHAYRASVRRRDDVAAQTSEAGAVVVASGRPRLLYVGNAYGADAALERGGYEVARVRPAAFPRTPGTLAGFDGVVLDDVANGELDPAQTRALASFVEESGGGLIVLGSARSLEPGVPSDDPVRRLLPLDLGPHAGHRSQALALVVVFDKSGSMDDRVGGVPKIEFARQAIGRVLETVRGTDALGVIAFDATPSPVAPLAAGHSAADLAGRLRDIRPDGATAIAPAIELAAAWLGNAPDGIARRHVLLVSDGRTTAADAARARAATTRGGFELTAVALGGDSDRPFLTALSEGTGGRAYFPEDVRELPSILAREAARVSGGTLVEETFQLRAADHAILSGIDPAALPRLGGYVVGARKPSADAVLLSHLDDPVLSTWRAGLGKVALYTADIHAQWSSGLRSWSGFSPLLIQTMRWAGRSAASGDLHARFDDGGGRVRLIVQAPDSSGESRSLLEVRAIVKEPAGTTTAYSLVESSPGVYEGNIQASSEGAYVIAIDARGRTPAFDASIVRGFYRPSGAERRHRGIDREALTALAAATGGRILAPGDDPFDVRRPAAYRDARAWLAAAASIVFLLAALGPAVRTLWRNRRRRALIENGLEDAA